MLQLTDVNFAFAKVEKSKISFSQKESNPSRKVLKNISFELETSSIAAVMGESGCGKSTLLNMIYGLLQADSGTIMWKKEELLGADNHLVPGHPMMKYVPQEFDLMPFTTVAENVGEHLSIQDDNRDKRIAALLDVVEMSNFSNRKVKTLSGGQKQRVAIAKALVQEPELLLLDEPFSHVDNFKKNALRRRLFAFLKEKGIAAIVATHDRDDVLSFTDETIIMRDGSIVDHRKTMEVYKNPQDVYGASLFDDVNSISAGFLNNNIALLLYPYQLKIVDNGYPARIENCFFKGDHFLVQVSVNDKSLWVKSDTPREIHEQVQIEVRI
jgi:ABC-type sulfate/molybdate transport systems ATPase subunit